MFDIGFSEIVLIFGLALVVLGPEKLPKLASTIGRWMGRARAMARQFQDQLETETASIKSNVTDLQKDIESSVSELKTGVHDAEQEIASLAEPPSDAVAAPPSTDDTKHHERGN